MKPPRLNNDTTTPKDYPSFRFTQTTLEPTKKVHGGCFGTSVARVRTYGYTIFPKHQPAASPPPPRPKLCNTLRKNTPMATTHTLNPDMNQIITRQVYVAHPSTTAQLRHTGRSVFLFSRLNIYCAKFSPVDYHGRYLFFQRSLCPPQYNAHAPN